MRRRPICDYPGAMRAPLLALVVLLAGALLAACASTADEAAASGRLPEVRYYVIADT